MPRSRLLKPGFFKNEHLAQLQPHARLCFAGLWLLADREGRLEDRPLRIKADIFPYENVDMDAVLNVLFSHGFITRYTCEHEAYISVRKFTQHQSPHVKETASTIPAPDSPGSSTRLALDEPSLDRLVLVTSSLSLLPSSDPDPESCVGVRTDGRKPDNNTNTAQRKMNGGSNHPVYIGARFKVFDWHFENIRRILGPNTDAFDLDLWFQDLDRSIEASGEVIPQNDGGKWLNAKVVEEAERRGLVVASSKPQTKRLDPNTLAERVREDMRKAGEL